MKKTEDFKVDRLIDAIKANKDLKNLHLDCLTDDGKIAKNHLPEEIKKRFYTKNQWLEKGYMPKENAVAYEMHSSRNPIQSKKLYSYFLDTDVEPIPDTLEICANCMYYGQGEYEKLNGYCIIYSGYPGANHRCSEFDKGLHEGEKDEKEKILFNRRI